MKEDTTILPFRHSDSVDDVLTSLARDGARRMLAEALVAEADAFVAGFSNDRLADGRQRVVRHGFGPKRAIQTGIGAVEVRRPKVRDRAGNEGKGERVRFCSNILPKWARRTRGLDALLPVLYLRGLSTGDPRLREDRFPGSACGASRSGRAQPVAERHLSTDFGLAKGLRGLASPRSLCCPAVS